MQVQGGTSAVTAFVQQGSQMLGVLGPIGAAAGAVLAVVGGLAGAWLKSGEEAEKNADVLKEVLSPAFLQAKDDIDEYIKALGGASEAQRRFVGASAGVSAGAIASAAGAAGSGLIEGRIGQYRQALLAQVPLLPAGMDLNDEGSILSASRAQASKRGALAEQRVGDLTGRLRQAIDAGDADAVARVIDESGLLQGADEQTFKLAGALQQDAKEVAARKALKAAAQYGPDYERPVGLGTNTPYANDNLAASIGKWEPKPGEAARDYVIEGNRKAEGAARQLKARTEQGQRLLQQLTLQADAEKRVADATELGTAAVKRAQIANEEERKLLEAARLLKGDDLELAKEKIHAIAEQECKQLDLNEAQKRGVNAGMWETSGGSFRSAERESMESYEKYARDQTNGIGEGQGKQARAYADVQRDILIQPWKDLSSEVSSITQSMFDDLLTRGKISMSSLADGVGDLLKNTITGTAANLVTLPINTAISSIATKTIDGNQDFTQVASQFGKDHPYLASGALGATGGYIAGSLYGQLTGKQDTYASTGGAVGGALGAVAGTALFGPAGGIVGGLLGSAGGSFLGGLFGGGKMGNDASNQDYWTSKGKITWSDSSYSPENRAITSGLGGQLAALQESLGGLGASFDNIGIKLSAGNKSGIRVNGKEFANQEEALPYAIRQLLDASGGLSGSQQTALAHTKGRSAQEVLSDVAFAKEFDKLTFKGTEFEGALRDLNERFDETGRRTKELGLDEQVLAETRAKAVERLQTEKNRQDRDLDVSVLNAIEGDGLQSAVRSLDNGFAQLIDRMTDAGYSSTSLAAAEAARVRQQNDLVKQYDDQAKGLQSQLEQQVRGVGSFYDGLIDPLKAVANDNAALNPMARISAAQRQYETDLAGFQSGDLQATQRLASSSQGFLNLSSQYLGTGGQAAEIARRVRSELESAAGSLERQKVDTLATLPQVQRETVASQTAVLVSESQRTRDVLERILREFGNLRRIA